MRFQQEILNTSKLKKKKLKASDLIKATESLSERHKARSMTVLSEWWSSQTI